MYTEEKEVKREKEKERERDLHSEGQAVVLGSSERAGSQVIALGRQVNSLRFCHPHHHDQSDKFRGFCSGVEDACGKSGRFIRQKAPRVVSQVLF